MTFEDFLKIAVPLTVILGPLFASMFTIHAKLARIEQRLDGEKERIEEAIDRHDKHIHEIRNSLHLISINLAKKGFAELAEKEHR